MGGCRCTFRSCENSSSSRPGMHFFHFPIRDWSRLEIWAYNAEKVEFKDLPQSKLKNKVICQEHFENRMFMNYLKEGLVKTAIPTLDILEDGRVYNIETNVISEREEWLTPEMSNTEGDAGSAPTQSQTETTRMEIQFLDSDQEEFRITPIDEPQPAIPDRAPSPVPVKLSLAENQTKTAPMTPPSNAVLRKVVIKRKNPPMNKLLPSAKVQVLSIQRVPKKLPTKAEVHQKEPVTEESPLVATPSSSTDVSVDKPEPIVKETPSSQQSQPPLPEPPVVQIVTDPSYVEKLEQATRGIEELKKILTDVLNKPPPEPKIITVPVPAPAPQPEPSGSSSSPKTEKGPHMNKVQLFNGIKRYLNPTMVAMLRMELFAGSVERQWKADEKTLAVELNDLGEKVYDHFCDEFRFRLPSKKDVQKWKEEALDDDGDAS